ncbi:MULTISPECIES: hypothetical protein, partial [unclassified Candidatus Paralachnospira]|uniref:hypothetical protein n=1 Tax=unclassified Candidatus Paralachnospira TaxID=3099471 RepID=UPI003F9027A1
SIIKLKWLIMTGIVAHTYPEWWLKLAGQVAHWSTDYSTALSHLYCFSILQYTSNFAQNIYYIIFLQK